MKLGCSSWSYNAAIRGGRMGVFDFIRICGDDLELDGVELLDQHIPATDFETLRRIKQELVAQQLTLAGIAVSNDFGRRERREVERAHVQQWCDVAAFLGAPIVRVFAGWLPQQEPPRDEGRIVGFIKRIVGPARLDTRRLWSDIAGTLRACADYAGERGITLALQNSRSDGVVGSPAQVAQLVRDVGSPWLKACLDPADLADRTGIEAAMHLVVQTHARMRQVAEDGADDRIAWPLLLQTLKLGRYRGFILLDYEGEERPEDAVPRAARYLRGLLHVIGRQKILAAAERGVEAERSAHSAEPVRTRGAAFTHPDLNERAVEDALDRLRRDIRAR